MTEEETHRVNNFTYRIYNVVCRIIDRPAVLHLLCKRWQLSIHGCCLGCLPSASISPHFRLGASSFSGPLMAGNSVQFGKAISVLVQCAFSGRMVKWRRRAEGFGPVWRLDASSAPRSCLLWPPTSPPPTLEEWAELGPGSRALQTPVQFAPESDAEGTPLRSLPLFCFEFNPLVTP